MSSVGRWFGASVVSGSVASLSSMVALAAAARLAGLGALQPVNATSHWLNGDKRGAPRAATWSYTAVGFGTHLAATVFWAGFFEGWMARRPAQGWTVVDRAAAISLLAVVVDYTVTPKRFTPGWELVLTKHAMASGYAAMAIGLTLGHRIVRATR